MWPGIVIVGEVVRKDAVKMPFVQHDHVVQTLPANAADDPFAIGILPGRPWCNRDFFNTHALDTLGEVITVDVIAIANEKTWRFLVREGVDDLLAGPFSVTLFPHISLPFSRNFGGASIQAITRSRIPCFPGHLAAVGREKANLVLTTSGDSARGAAGQD